jgi:mono/diheme cytochrome c family protein
MRAMWKTAVWALAGFAATASWADQAADANLDQGWSATKKTDWYTRSQGSRLLPLSWLQALEQPDASAPFLERAHIEKFRYLPNASSLPGQLPIGFAIDRQNDERFSDLTRLRWKDPQSSTEPWVGMNCAACHTAEMSYGGTRLRIEGGPTQADFQGFMRALRRALAQTRDDDAKWQRFAAAVLKAADRPENRAMLKAELARLVDWERRVERANETPLEYGFGRLDAFGHIFNKVVLRANAQVQPPSPADAPVSYPFLWNIHQHDKVQWNGVAPNNLKLAGIEVGALGRNVGEVLGVFADLTLRAPGPAAAGYRSSAHVGNLKLLEQQITLLRPPAWPAAFPPIDPDRWEAGKALFNAEGPGGCSSCHQVLQRKNLKTRFEARMTMLKGDRAIGTDPWMACNSYTARARTGVLRFTPPRFFFVIGGTPMGTTAPVSDMLNAAVIGSIWNQSQQVVASGSKALSGKPFSSTFDVGVLLSDGAEPATEDRAARLQRCLTEDSETLAYKGRPLMGVWATAPYLHNGSVPTLFDLLLPPERRPSSFAVGTRAFDPVRVGYVVDPAVPDNSFTFRTVDAAGRAIDGNGNGGHDYGNAALNDEQRWALVEYMKAVGGTRVGNRVVP